MRSYPSRDERRQENFYKLAEQGLLSMENAILYPSEIKKLEEKYGMKVKKVKDFKPDMHLVVADISWKNAYGYAIPHIVISYVTGQIETFPRASIQTFAQELWVIARRTANTTKQ